MSSIQNFYSYHYILLQWPTYITITVWRVECNEYFENNDG